MTTVGAVDGFRRGSVQLAVTAQGSGASQYVVDGNAKVINAGYVIPYVYIDGLNATTRLHITPDEIVLTDLVGRPRQGGIVNAELRYLNWSAPDNPPPAPSAAADKTKRAPLRPAQPPPVRPAMSIRARVHGVRLSTILESVADRGYQNYGFDTLGEGAVNIDWTGAADDLTVAAKLAMSAPQSSAPGLLPLSGSVDAKYFQHGGRVQIYQLEAHSPGTTLNTTGSLGVYPIEEPSNLTVHLVTHNLGEFDQVLKVLDLGLNGKKGISGVPVQLHGDATFDGSATGSLVDPAFAGHLTAERFSTEVVIPAAIGSAPSQTPQPSVGPVALPAATSTAGPATASATGAHPPSPPAAVSRTISWDHLDAIASYSSSLISVEKGTLTRGKTVIHAAGQLQAHQISRRRQAFDDESTINASAQVQDASLTDVLAIAGQDLPVTGTLSLQAHAGGTAGRSEWRRQP